MKRVRMVKYKPAARHMKINALLQMMLLMLLMTYSTKAPRAAKRKSRPGTGDGSILHELCWSAKPVGRPDPMWGYAWRTFAGAPSRRELFPTDRDRAKTAAAGSPSGRAAARS